MYANTFGSAAPLPYLSFWKRFNDKWEMTIGFPRTGVTFSPSHKNKWTAFAEFEGFSANIAKGIPGSRTESGKTGTRFGYRDTAAGLGYQRTFKKLFLKAKVAYTLDRKFELENANGDTVHKTPLDKGLYIGIGAGFRF